MATIGIGPRLRAAINKKRGKASPPLKPLGLLVRAFSPGASSSMPGNQKRVARAIRSTSNAVDRIARTKGITRQAAAADLRKVAGEIRTRNRIARDVRANAPSSKASSVRRAVITQSRRSGVRLGLLKFQTSSFVIPDGRVSVSGFPGGPQSRRITPRQPNLTGMRKISIPRK